MTKKLLTLTLALSGTAMAAALVLPAIAQESLLPEGFGNPADTPAPKPSPTPSPSSTATPKSPTPSSASPSSPSVGAQPPAVTPTLTDATSEVGDETGDEEEVASGRSLEDVAADAGDRPNGPLPRMLQAALREWREARNRGAASDTQAALLIQRVDRVLDAIVAREGAKAEDGLGVLAIVATASPFVGLFGTVWGIMHAFQAIAVQKNTNLSVVAPSIAEALFATAIGLVAAIPAYIAYNKFSTDAAKFGGRLESFADDLAAAVARRLSDRAQG